MNSCRWRSPVWHRQIYTLTSNGTVKSVSTRLLNRDVDGDIIPQMYYVNPYVVTTVDSGDDYSESSILDKEIDAVISLVSNMCQHIDCIKFATHGYSGTGRMQYCNEHKLYGMTPVIVKKSNKMSIEYITNCD